MGFSGLGERGARQWQSAGGAGAFAYRSQPSATLRPSFSGRSSSSGHSRPRCIARRSSTRSAQCPPTRLCRTATLGTRSNRAYAPCISLDTAGEDDISSSIGSRAGRPSISSGFCTTRWTSAGTFPTLRRLADPSESVEHLRYQFDTHLTPNLPNFADFGRRKCRARGSQEPRLEFKTPPGDLLRLA